MNLLYITLYQPDSILHARLPAGVESLAALLRTVQSRLVQPEFECPPEDDRAIVIAIHSSGAMRGWVCSKSRTSLLREQEYLEALLGTVVAPQVVGGSVMVAMVYARSTATPHSAAEVWMPIPHVWSEVAERSAEPLDVESLVSLLFRE
jgi:hypothetical protein